ncbi:unnamed protein product [marine sediment metagenome]|uniref:DNA replication complex GINS family protein n=1 Tax=marine sediment metagenome TaxID=412755 RepID=X1PDK8_9ZZZZ
MIDKIFDLWKREREGTKILPMSIDFYSVMRDDLKKRTKKAKEQINPLIKTVLEAHLGRIKFVVNDLIKIRSMKIIQLVIRGDEVKVNLAREEINFYQRLKAIYGVYRKEIFSPKDVAYTDIGKILDEESDEVGDSIEYVAIRIVKKTKEITGLDGNIYGPFEPEDVCLLPKENAIGLVRRDIAEDIALAEIKRTL